MKFYLKRGIWHMISSFLGLLIIDASIWRTEWRNAWKSGHRKFWTNRLTLWICWMSWWNTFIRSEGLNKRWADKRLIDTVVGRGRLLKTFMDRKMYYQVNTTIIVLWEKMTGKMLIARAVQLFMPENLRYGILIFCRKNDYEAVKSWGRWT